MVLLRRPEVQFAEADGNDVWLVTDEGRLQAAVRGIDKLKVELAGGEFLRVHRRFLVNLSRVRVVERGPRGELSLIMEGSNHAAVPVFSSQRPDRTPRATMLSTPSAASSSHDCSSLRTSDRLLAVDLAQQVEEVEGEGVVVVDQQRAHRCPLYTLSDLPKERSPSSRRW